MLSSTLSPLPQLQPLNVLARKATLTPPPIEPPTQPTLQADTFVKTANPPEAPQNKPRAGLKPPSLGDIMKIGGVSLLGLGAVGSLLYWVAKTGAEGSYKFQKMVMKDALTELNDEQNNACSKSQASEQIPPVVPKTRSGTLPYDAAQWFMNNVLEGAMNLSTKDEKVRQVVLQKLEAGFRFLEPKGTQLTPDTFFEMVAHLKLSPFEVDALHCMVNQVLIAVNEQKPLQSNQLDYGIINLSYAVQLEQEKKPQVALVALESAIRAIETELPDMHSMLQYQARYTLVRLYQLQATVCTQLGDTLNAEKASVDAQRSYILALYQGEYDRFVASFFTGFIKQESLPLRELEAKALQMPLDLMDVHPPASFEKRLLETQPFPVAKQPVLPADVETPNHTVADAQKITSDERAGEKSNSVFGVPVKSVLMGASGVGVSLILLLLGFNAAQRKTTKRELQPESVPTAK
jgi:hypothetical protein